MAWCFLPTDESERIFLRDISSRKYDDNEDGKELRDHQGTYHGSDDAGDIDDEIKNTFWGYFFGLVGVAAIVTALACTQILDHSVPHSELNGLIYTGQLIIVSPFLIGYKKCDVRVERTSIGWLILGLIIGTASTYGHYGAAYYLPLGICSGISRSVALVINYLISCIGKKTVIGFELIAAIMCICGVAMVTQPLFALYYSENSSQMYVNMTYTSPCHHVSEHVNVSTNTSHYTDIAKYALAKRNAIVGYSISVTTGLISAAYLQCVRQKLADFDSYIYNFWASIFGMVSSFSIMAAMETPFFPTVSICIMLLLITIFSAGLRAILIFRAYQLLDPVISALIQTLQIPCTFILQYTILSKIHPGHATVLEKVGTLTIFLGNSLVPTYQLLRLYLKNVYGHQMKG